MTQELRRHLRVQIDARRRERLAQVTFCRGCGFPHEHGERCDLCQWHKVTYHRDRRTAARPA
jgi:hypothetical protein